MLKITQTGPQTLLQDAGRQGCLHLGIAQSGAADQHALHMANRLAGSSRLDTAALEITFGIFKCTFTADTRIGLAGAPCRAFINGQPLQPYCGISVNKGDTLTLKGVTSGVRTYLAVWGGFHTPRIYQSQAMHPKEAWSTDIPPIFSHGDTLAFTSPPTSILRKPTAYLKASYWPDFTTPLTLHLTPSYQYDQFDTAEIARLCRHTYTVHADSDRMGTRLTGAAITWSHAGIVSQPIAIGAVQIPPRGQPIVLLNDRQTLGGYPVIGCVNQDQLGALSQRQANQPILFSI